MNTKISKVVYWSPRLLAVLFALFLSLFATDVFNQTGGFFSIAAAFLIHLIPAFIILIVLIISWKREWIGAFIYVFLGFYYIFKTFDKFDYTTLAVISGPLFLMSILFFISWIVRKNKQS
ncbi:MAG: hypothetical protein K8F36_01910 [Melioribacteraceae bacterium]|nr:hypothetical protein [Melioribacteraceae bacterium]